ncbi:hypothetical protein J6590_108757 [Homalodisca vitripennis]|nr:hypothetical protein J6590_108757 [Homalodisca vitripennis]
MKERSHIWFHANKLKVNQEKTENIVFSLSSRPKGSENKSVKLLGINLDSSLTWGVHTNSLCSRLSRVIFCLKKLKLCTSPSILINAYFSLFHSHLLYGTILWGNSAGAKEVFKCQKKAIRCLVNISETDSCKPFFIELGILTLPSIYILQSLVFIKENLTSFSLRNSVHSYNTRSVNLIDVKYTRLSKSQHSYIYIGTKLFNKLPLNAKTMSTKNFKNMLIKWLKVKAFYSVEEVYLSDFNNIEC